ncbi:DUF6276 family protein [Halobium salinum]|uniref:DUF6276 family protein n=1 Tax=Halobium salinum TaxID=1364940 RepID=A0ABD5PF76_9EURY|nr:DUF6276 family protein [Halobium salinum]
MDCPHCDGDLVAFAVPEDFRKYAPDETGSATICATCLRVEAAEGEAAGADPDFSAVDDSFPSGRGGVATALLLGKLDSLALNRADISELADEAEQAGADPFLTLDRLASSPTIEPHFDIDRRRPQLEQLME